MKNVTKLSEQELKTSNKTSWHDQYRDSSWIFIGGLPYDLTEGDIICVFSQYGEIVNINLVRDKKSGKQKGFCFLCYEDQRSTVLAVDNFNGIKVNNRRHSIMFIRLRLFWGFFHSPYLNVNFFFTFLNQILGKSIRVDHVQDYKVPKDDDRYDEITKSLHEQGCGPKEQIPEEFVKRESSSFYRKREKSITPDIKRVKKERLEHDKVHDKTFFIKKQFLYLSQKVVFP
jgi:RNA-binding motif protein, X-linked 2